MPRRRAASRAVIWSLVVVMSVEAVIATLLRGQHLLDRLTGGGGRLSPLAIVGLLWLPVLALALALAIREFRLLTAEADLASAQLTSAAVVTRDWFWAIDVEGRITYSSATSRAFVGFDPAELLGRSVLDLVHPDDVAQARAGLRQAVDSQVGWTDRLVRVLAADGGPLVVEQSAVAAFDASGRFVGFRGSCRIARAERLAAASRERARAAIELVMATGAFRPAFQPIVSLVDGQVVGVEALTRFDPMPYEPPDVWFERAKACGVGEELELAALRRILAAADALPPDLYVSLNVSPSLAAAPEFAEALASSTVPLHRVVAELTENEWVEDYQRLAATLAPLRAQGLRVAVDDAGAGYASFQHIVQLRPDIIKLDRELVRDVDTDATRRALAGAVLLFAMELPASVTAEGVETEAQLDALDLLGVDAVQGFHVARPTTNSAVWRSWGVRQLTATLAWAGRSTAESARPRPA